MKKLILILLIVLSGCAGADDCFKKAGAMTEREFTVEPFRKILVGERISVVIKQADETRVRVKSGENFIDDVKVEVADGTLKLSDQSGCNMVRDYDLITVYVDAPDIEEIYSNTGLPIKSDGVLTYPILRLFAMDFFGGVGTGNFYLEIDNEQVVVENNYVAGYYLTGHTNELLLNFYDGNGRFEGDAFTAESIKIFQRGANDMIVRPLQSLTGDIYSTGNVICKTQPPFVDVRRHYTGRLIFD